MSNENQRRQTIVAIEVCDDISPSVAVLLDPVCSEYVCDFSCDSMFVKGDGWLHAERLQNFKGIHGRKCYGIRLCYDDSRRGLNEQISPMERRDTRFETPLKGIRSLAYRYPAYALVVVCGAVPLLVGLTIGGVFTEFYRRPYYSGIVVVIALAIGALVYLNRATLWPALKLANEQVRMLHPNWLLVIAAIGLRYLFLLFLPPDFAAFEEVNQGRFAWNIVYAGDKLTFHQIFTNGISALSLSYLGNELHHLRASYEFAGALSILLVAIGLRRLNLSWTATLVVVFTMATMRWAVIAGGFAEESFGGLFLATLLFVGLILSDTSRKNYAFWAGIVGLASGLLLYEYVPFFVLAPVPVAYWFIRAYFSNRATERRRVVLRSLWFIALFTFMAAPLLSQLIYDPIKTHPGDTMFRHRIVERGTERFSTEYFQQWATDAADYMSVAFGLDVKRPSKLFRASDDSVVPLIIGVMFAVAVLDALRRPRAVYPFFLALFFVLYCVVIAIPSDRFYVGRMTSLIPVLVILSGIMLARMVSYFLRQRPKNERMISLFAIGFAAVVVWVNFSGTTHMARDEGTLVEYTNNKYAVCRSIGVQPYSFEKVITVSNVHCSFGDEVWLYPELEFEAVNQDSMPTLEELTPGTLVLVGDNRGLDGELINATIALANAAGSESTLRETKTMLDRTGTVSFCYRCN